MYWHFADYMRWLISPCLQAGVGIAMRHRGLDRDFPFFFRYTILQVLSVPCLIFAATLSYQTYCFSYWIAGGVSALLSFAVIRELFQAAFQPFDDLCRLGDSVFRWAVGVVLMVTVLALFSGPMPYLYRLTDGILVADRLVYGMLFALVALLLLSSHHLEISWREVPFGIALGFLGFTLTKVVFDTPAQRPSVSSLRLGWINGVVYVSSSVIWLAYAALGVGCPRIGPEAGQSLDPGSADERAQSLPAIEIINHLVDRLYRR